ncbi:DUF465 domain-containing protein [Sphingomonas sp. SM33]|jgi:hypothetical protein|uniref:DUF465 domain-containing protein n=1 Tax=Sphingomonas telluris TaxID=2907998 RepID=A0ABS9VLK5_9SPHN|nr:DUF465 domain-containing protein [Sphingomonas telluris]MCH8615603.1 DUF465 domain-containing protein [Sphingomonas telluris]
MDETIRVELETMRAEHRRLDDEIAALSSEGITDQLEIARLKRRKLLLKDQIQLFINQHTPDIIA